jgi:hypothetical protein
MIPKRGALVRILRVGATADIYSPIGSRPVSVDTVYTRDFILPETRCMACMRQPVSSGCSIDSVAKQIWSLPNSVLWVIRV